MNLYFETGNWSSEGKDRQKSKDSLLFSQCAGIFARISQSRLEVMSAVVHSSHEFICPTCQNSHSFY